MTMTLVKALIDAITHEERFFVAPYLHHLANRDDPEHIARLAEAKQRLDAGPKVSFEERVQRHEGLLAV